ncbi:hypothetical protein [Romboutsia ilealis]|uniref:hypothetical protein n=1 Tax=Romboutsia ilealis TaxID=1115758 RepID=UPI00272C90E7|nr:hypothetical protein [Romboutsia ilealis]
MGFLDFMGEMFGSLVGEMTAKAKDVNIYKNEYEMMSDRQLKREFQDLVGKQGREYECRRLAISSIMNDRNKKM